MDPNLFLPKHFKLPNGSKIDSLTYFNATWQIFTTTNKENLLVCIPEKAQAWIDIKLLDNSAFFKIEFDGHSYLGLTSEEQFSLAPVNIGRTSHNSLDIITFALALKESRKLATMSSFHDSIYLEQRLRLLPTWTPTPRVDDTEVLANWIPCKNYTSANPDQGFSLKHWLEENDLTKIFYLAGLTPPKEISDSIKPTKRFLPKSQKKFKLPGCSQLELFFNEYVFDIILNLEKYKVFGINFPAATILHGPPGCGKTFAVEKFVDFLAWPSYSINSNTIGSPFIHDTSRKISEIFDKAIKKTPSVIVIDEMESFLPDRMNNTNSESFRIEEVGEFLRRIPEAINKNVLIIAMTNMIDIIDPAILRRGRFDHIIEVKKPSRKDIISLINSLLTKIPVADDINFKKAIDLLTGRPLSDSAFVIREAGRLAAKNDKPTLDQDCLELALNSMQHTAIKQKQPDNFADIAKEILKYTSIKN
jgi:Cdc6-like AAA superfamily ATPase